MKFEIVKGSANYLLVCLCYGDENGNMFSGKEIVSIFGPCAAVSYAPTKKALINLCKRENLELI